MSYCYCDCHLYFVPPTGDIGCSYCADVVAGFRGPHVPKDLVTVHDALLAEADDMDGRHAYNEWMGYYGERLVSA